ncbi:MAG TPA: hypothetical protein VHH73_07870, partial [Verrucomicrobiae bacterium]|nr:hypothetical protein [Verrucomicrobiae bacterium]
VQFQATGNTVYYVAVDGVHGATGNVKLSYDLVGDTKFDPSTFTVPPQFSLSVQIGRTYSVQVSKDSAFWAELFSTNAATGTLNVVDSHATAFTNRFYKVIANP